MNNRSIRTLKVEYAEVKVVIICKIKPLIHRNVALTRQNTTGRSLSFWIIWSYWNIIAGKRVNLIISKKIPNSFFRERSYFSGQSFLTRNSCFEKFDARTTILQSNDSAFYTQKNVQLKFRESLCLHLITMDLKIHSIYNGLYIYMQNTRRVFSYIRHYKKKGKSFKKI